MKKILLFITLINFTIIQAQIVNIPDVNFKNALLSASSTTHIAKDLNDNWVTIDVNNDGEIQNSETENIIYLDVFYKNINSLDGINAFTMLEYIKCSSNHLTTIDFSNNLALTEVDCSFNNIETLNLTSNASLINLSCGYNNINNLNLINNTSLLYLSCPANELSTLNINTNISLIELYCNSNNLNTLDLSANTSITHLNCSLNEISSLDLNPNISLIDLSCYSTNLTLLDLGANTNLIHVYCFSIPDLEYINLHNGNNHNYIPGGDDFQDLPNLLSVCVDDITSDLVAFIDSFSDHLINYSEDCSTLSINNETILSFSVYPIPTKNILNIKSKTKITKIKIFSELGQLIKETSENKIDVSNLAQGLYFVKVEDINGSFGVKMIVKK